MTTGNTKEMLELLKDRQAAMRIAKEAGYPFDNLTYTALTLAINSLETPKIILPEPVGRDDADGYWMLKGGRLSAANAAYYNECLKDLVSLNPHLKSGD